MSFSPKCGHTYSRDAIMAHLQKKAVPGRRGARQAAPCPVAGCAVEVEASALMVNDDITRKLAKAARRKPSNKRKPDHEEEILRL